MQGTCWVSGRVGGVWEGAPSPNLLRLGEGVTGQIAQVDVDQWCVAPSAPAPVSARTSSSVKRSSADGSRLVIVPM